MDDEFEGKGAKARKELVRGSLQPTMPPLTLAVPSTGQQADTTDSVASMARECQGSLTSAGVDQWSLLGLGRDEKKKEKDKQGHGKGEDKGKLSPQRVLQPRAASSTGFIRVPPPLSPHRGGAAPGPVLVEFHNYRKKYRSLQRSKLGRNVRKKMYGPFPPHGNVRPTKLESSLRLCNKEPIKKRNVPEVSSMAQHP